MAKGKKTTQTGEGGGTHGDLNIRVITPPGSIRVDQLHKLRNCPVLVGVVIDLSQHYSSYGVLLCSTHTVQLGKEIQ